MTLTFENDNDVIVYALEKIISYARKHQYIFVGQSIWWIASVIGLTEGLATHIDNLRTRETLKSIGLLLKDQPDKVNDVIPQDIPDCPVNTVGLGIVHPDSITQINGDDSIQGSDCGSGRASRIIEETKRFLNKSRKETNTLPRKPEVLSRTRSGQLPAKALSKKQISRLQAIPKDTISAYLKLREK